MFNRGARATSVATTSKTRRGALLSLVAIGVLAFTAACAPTSTGSTAGGDAGGGSEYNIGLISAETGSVAGVGKSFLAGARLAEQQINEQGVIGEGKTIKLVEKETGEDPARSASVAGQLAADPSILGTICCILSPVAGAVKPVAIKSQMPLIIYGATEPGLAELPYVVRTTTMPQPANTQISESLAKDDKLKTAAYVVMTDNAGIVSQGESFKEGLDAAGVEDLGQVGIVSKQTNFTSSADQVMQLDPDAIVVAGTQSEAVGMIAALHDKGYDGQIITGETILGTGVFKSNPDALVDAPFPVYFLASEASPQGKTFAEAFTAANGTDPDDFAAQGYNAVYTMAIGLKDAGENPTRESLTEALGAITTLPDTIYGEVTFKDGQIDASQGVKIVHYTKPDGAIAPYTPGQ